MLDSQLDSQLELKKTHLSHQFQIAVWFSSSYYMYMPLGIDDFFSWRITWTLSKNMLESCDWWSHHRRIHFSTRKNESSATYFSHLLLQGLILEFLKNKNFVILCNISYRRILAKDSHLVNSGFRTLISRANNWS